MSQSESGCSTAVIGVLVLFCLYRSVGIPYTCVVELSEVEFLALLVFFVIGGIVTIVSSIYGRLSGGSEEALREQKQIEHQKQTAHALAERIATRIASADDEADDYDELRCEILEGMRSGDLSAEDSFALFGKLVAARDRIMVEGGNSNDAAARTEPRD
jgi:hypothetical protein